MRLGNSLGQLTYCTNIHAGEPLADVMSSLAQYLPGIKSQISPAQPLGVGLRVGAEAARSLQEPQAFERLQAFLADGGYYVFTLNGFPFGPFHGQPVKEGAYKPDWADPVRVEYTNGLADLLAALLPEGQHGTISTVPCTFKPWAQGRVDAITRNLVDHVAHLIDIRERTGKVIALALEPEPFCFLETIAETVDFFNEVLFDAEALTRLSAASGLAGERAEEAMRRHIGVCYDVCHAAVEFEDPADSIAQLRRHGISIGKLQLSSALRVASMNAASTEKLSAFAEPVYLHQVVQKTATGLSRFADLPEALAQAKSAHGAEWRVHFHVPLFLNRFPEFETTQSFLKEILALHRAAPISDHLEVETYTWDVLPDALRNVDLGSAIARELNWVLTELGEPGRAA